MNEPNKKEQAMLWRAEVMALGHALRHEYEASRRRCRNTCAS